MNVWRWLTVFGVVLVAAGLAWYLVPFAVTGRMVGLSTADVVPLGMVSPNPSYGPWIYSLPSHDSVGHVGVCTHFMMNVPSPTGVTWAIVCCVKTMPKGYYLFWGILDHAYTSSSTIWVDLQDCSPAEGKVQGVEISSSGDVRFLKKGGYAAAIDIDAIDYASAGQVFFEWIPEAQVSSWRASHEGSGQGGEAVSPALGGLLTSGGGLCAVVIGAVKSGVFM